MQYDASWKRAERLLRKNFEACKREAHRLAAMGLPIVIGETNIRLFPTYGATDDFIEITPAGIEISVVKFWCCNDEPTPGQTDYYESEYLGGGQVENIAAWLRAQLEGLKSRAKLLDEAARKLAEVKAS